MRAVIQRVTNSIVTVNNEEISSISEGLLILLGIMPEDNEEDINWLSSKCAKMRIFRDENGQMNRSVTDINGDVMVVSQFTLAASTKKGNRPGFTRAAKPDIAIPLYESFCKKISDEIGKKAATGIFGADMQISFTNDGPVTIVMDTKNLE